MSPSPSAHVVDVSESNFETEVIKASEHTVILVDLWAEWCGPCKTLAPILDAVADGFNGAIRIAKIDVDANPNLAAAFGAQSIPLVVAVYQGQPIDKLTGARPRQEIEQWVNSLFEAIGVELHITPQDVVPSDPIAASAYYEAKLQADDGNQHARLEWGKLLMSAGKTEAAEGLLNAIPATAAEFGPGQAALKLKQLWVELAEAGGEAHWRSQAQTAPPSDDTTYFLALADGVLGEYAAALAALVTQVGILRDDLRSRALKSAQVLLAAAGRGDDGVEAQRRKLGRLLF